jgi:hypothetical protein
MRLSKLLISIFLIVSISCKNSSDGFFPNEIKLLKVEKLQKYKSYLFINDSISFSGTYFFEDSSGIILYDQIKIGDIIINDGFPRQYLDLRKKDTGDTLRFYVFGFKQ